MRNAEIHMLAGFGSILLTAAIVVPTVFMKDAAAEHQPELKDYEVIEASIAYKAPTAQPKPKQPQKEMKETVPDVKPEGVSHDENKKPDEKKPDEKKPDPPKKDDVVDPLKKFARSQDDDNPTGAVVKPSADVGSEKGVGDVSKGDPYLGQLMADLNWTVPELARAGESPTIGCIKLNQDGTVARVWFESTGSDDVAIVAKKALDDLKKLRDTTPIPVPEDGAAVLKRLTSKGICINLTAK
ncbi:MAG TPA: hypothetical protein VGM90_01370 [Kofleriaceae bacterium]|jgi:hypothetical protein